VPGEPPPRNLLGRDRTVVQQRRVLGRVFRVFCRSRRPSLGRRLQPVLEARRGGQRVSGRALRYRPQPEPTRQAIELQAIAVGVAIAARPIRAVPARNSPPQQIAQTSNCCGVERSVRPGVNRATSAGQRQPGNVNRTTSECSGISGSNSTLRPAASAAALANPPARSTAASPESPPAPASPSRFRTRLGPGATSRRG